MALPEERQSRHRALDRTLASGDHLARYRVSRPGRDVLTDLAERKYQRVIDAAWAKILAKYERGNRRG